MELEFQSKVLSFTMESFTVGTWNILGDSFHRDARLILAANEIANLDVVALQEIVFGETEEVNTAHRISQLSGLKIASCIQGGIRNFVSGELQGTVILTRLEILEDNLHIEVNVPSAFINSPECNKYAAALLRSPSGRSLYVVSLHLPWGAENEYRRVKQLEVITTAISKKLVDLPTDTIAVIAGDFNTTPSSDSLRFLRGEFGKRTHATFWIDAWAATENSQGYTVDTSVDNLNIERTALESGIRRPEMMPSRRIDYVFFRGWVYGRAGSPLASWLIGTKPSAVGLHASDHFGVATRVWDPPR